MKLFSSVANLALIAISLIRPASALNEQGIHQLRHLQPSNDECDNATPINFDENGIAVLHGETTLGANREDASMPECVNSLHDWASGVWYSFSVKGGPKRITVYASDGIEDNFNIAVYQGSCADLTCVAAHQDFYGEAEVDTGAQKTQIYILIRGYLIYGNFDLTVKVEAAKHCSKNCQKYAASICKESLECSEKWKGRSMGDCIKSICKDFEGSCEGNCGTGFALQPITGEVICTCRRYQCEYEGTCCPDVNEFCAEFD